MIRNGELDVYPEVAQAGRYFDIDYKRGKLVLKATKYVGYIPISDSIAIQVTPRVPIPRLIRMVARSGHELTRLEGFARMYEPQLESMTTIEQLYAETFLSALEKVSRTGLLKRYVPRQTEREWSGRPLLSRTVSRFRSKGYRHHAVFEVVDFTVNNLENQVLKSVAGRLLAYFEQNPVGREASLARAKTLLKRFATVDDRQTDLRVAARALPGLIRALPRSRNYYEAPLWLAYLIASGSGFALERVGRAKFDSVLVDVATVFEKYVRTLCAEAAEASAAFCGSRVFDGNKYPIPLFRSGQAEVYPDMYFKKQSTITAIADAKYKPKISPADRYELIAFAEAAQLKRAAFVSPLLPGSQVLENYGTTPSGLELFVVRIDLAAPDIRQEERAFVDRLSSVLFDEANIAA